MTDSHGRPFAVLTLLNKKGATQFDERVVRDLTTSLGVVLRTWHQAHSSRQASRS